jgi:hypothetical protein
MPRRRTFAPKPIQATWWDRHESVIIRPLREEDQEIVQDQLAEMVAGEGKNASMSLKLGTSRRLTMLQAIQSWTLTDEFGNPLPLTEQSIRDLAPEDADFIHSEINALNQPMTNDEKKDFSMPAVPGMQESPVISRQ